MWVSGHCLPKTRNNSYTTKIRKCVYGCVHRYLYLCLFIFNFYIKELTIGIATPKMHFTYILKYVYIYSYNNQGNKHLYGIHYLMY